MSSTQSNGDYEFAEKSNKLLSLMIHIKKIKGWVQHKVMEIMSSQRN